MSREDRRGSTALLGITLALTVVLSVAVASASYALVEEPARVAVTRWEKRRHIGEPAKGNAANPVTTKATNIEN